MKEHHDVVIVGAGPAGAAAAFFLSLQGSMDVLVLDRMWDEERFSRYHSICGEGISEKAFASLRPLEPWHARQAFREAEMVWPGGVSVRRDVKGLILDRPRFLREVLDRAQAGGCRVENAALVAIKARDDGFDLTLRDGREMGCRYLIGADGAFSIVRRELFGSKPRMSVPVKQFLMEEDAPRSTDKAVIYMGERYGGCYRWDLPCGGMSNIGFPKGTDAVEGAHEEGARYLPFGGVGDIVKGNALLIGDAAAQANPVCFGGLRAAMTAARKAADAVLRGDPMRYARWWRRSLWSSPRFMRTHIRLASWSDEDMERAVAPFRDGVRPLAVAKAVLTMPGNIPMYIACLITFRYTW